MIGLAENLSGQAFFANTLVVQFVQQLMVTIADPGQRWRRFPHVRRGLSMALHAPRFSIGPIAFYQPPQSARSGIFPASILRQSEGLMKPQDMIGQQFVTTG